MFCFFPFSQNYRVNVASAVNILSSTSTSFGGGAGQIDEKLQQQLLEEEEHAMKQFKVNSKIFYKVKVSNSQKHFFMTLYCPKNERNIKQNSALEFKKWINWTIKGNFLC